MNGVEDLRNVATIASGSVDMGRIIAQAFDRVGENGSTVVEESQTLVDEIEFTEGLTIDRGFISPYLVKDDERHEEEFLTFPHNLTSIGQNAFEYCAALASIELPDTLLTSLVVHQFLVVSCIFDLRALRLHAKFFASPTLPKP